MQQMAPPFTTSQESTLNEEFKVKTVSDMGSAQISNSSDKEMLQLPAITLINHAVHSFSTQNETGNSYMSVPNSIRANETTIFESCFVDQYNCP